MVVARDGRMIIIIIMMMVMMITGRAAVYEEVRRSGGKFPRAVKGKVVMHSSAN